jgi:hypothetical protein
MGSGKYRGRLLDFFFVFCGGMNGKRTVREDILWMVLKTREESLLDGILDDFRVGRALWMARISGLAGSHFCGPPVVNATLVEFAEAE